MDDIGEIIPHIDVVREFFVILSPFLLLLLLFICRRGGRREEGFLFLGFVSICVQRLELLSSVGDSRRFLEDSSRIPRRFLAWEKSAQWPVMTALKKMALIKDFVILQGSFFLFFFLSFSFPFFIAAVIVVVAVIVVANFRTARDYPEESRRFLRMVWDHSTIYDSSSSSTSSSSSSSFSWWTSSEFSKTLSQNCPWRFFVSGESMRKCKGITRDWYSNPTPRFYLRI